MVGSVAVDLDRAYRTIGLDARLREVPATASIRGVFFDMIGSALRRHGLAQSPAWRNHAERRRLYELYPIHDYLVAFATASALIHPDPHEGMRDIYSDGARFFASTWFGKALQRMFRPDPAPALAWIERSRDHFVNYGRWRVEHVEPGLVVIHMFDEYVWIDAAHRGGCEGLLVACGVEGSVLADLDGPFSGRLQVRWRVRH
jgi:uncharacterized protein (TIGR02265 family)